MSTDVNGCCSYSMLTAMKFKTVPSNPFDLYFETDWLDNCTLYSGAQIKESISMVFTEIQLFSQRKANLFLFVKS